MTTTYRPTPLDTSDVELPSEVAALLERLAHNTHENWAAQRISEGWTWGPVVDDDRRQHPMLVPYAQLPESEKAYDRLTSGETLKALIKLGFELRRR